MKILNRIIVSALSAVILVSQSAAFASVRTDLTAQNAASGAMEITEDMIYKTQNDVTTDQLMKSMFNYALSDSEVKSERNAYNADFTLYFGENNAKNILLFRAYVYGSDNDEVNVPIKIYGSMDDTSWEEIGSITDPVEAAWNETDIKSVGAYRYIKVESEISENQAESIDDEGTLTEQNTKTYHQRITKAVFIAQSDTESEETESSSSSTADSQTNDVSFTDISGHWAEKTIREYASRGILNGYEDGTFRPDNGVSVAEFCKIVSAIKGVNYKISEGNWALPYIREMLAKGIIERTDFVDYNKKMTREEVAKASLAQMSGEYYPKNLEQFQQYIADFDAVSQSHEEFVLKTYISGVLAGYEDGTWKPQQGVTRAEILSVLDRVYNKDMREIPDALSNMSSESPNQYYYYSAAVQVRKNTSPNAMQYRLYGSDAQYMEEDDAATGLKMSNEIQGAQGFAMVVRYDLSKVKEYKEQGKLKKLYVDAKWLKNGSKEHELGLWYYTKTVDKTDWNNVLYMKNVNNSAVAGDDTSGYNSIISNIEAQLPTWGNNSMAVPNSDKTKPIAKSTRDDNGNYMFDITDIADDVLANASESGMIEFIITSVNYDGINVDDDKPQIYIAGENAPKLNAEYDIEGGIE